MPPLDDKSLLELGPDKEPLDDTLPVEDTPDQQPMTTETESGHEPAQPEWFTDELRDRADLLGITEEIALNFGSAEELEKALDHTAMSQFQQWQQPQQVAPPPPPPQWQQPQYQPPQQQYWGPPPLSHKPDETEGDPIAQDLRTMHEYTAQLTAAVQAEIQRMQMALGQVVDTMSTESSRKTAAEFDALCDEAPEEYAHLLGKGSIFNMPQGSLQWQNRQRMYQALQSVRSGFENVGRRPTYKQAFNEALRLAFGSVVPPKQQTEQMQRDMRGRFVSRSTVPPSPSSGQAQRLAENPMIQQVAARTGLPIE